VPDQYGNPTEAERRGQVVSYQPSLGDYTPATKAAVAARNKSGISTRDVYANGQVTHDERATPKRDTRGGAPVFQGAFMDDPFYQRSDVAPVLAATNRDVGGQGIGTKLANAGKFELSRATDLVKNVVHDPSRLVTGVDPASTKVWNSVLGTNKRALVDQLGGATGNDFSRYEAKNGFGSLGAARELSHSADAIAGMLGAAGAMHGLSQAYQGITGAGSQPVSEAGNVVNTGEPGATGWGGPGTGGFNGASDFAPGMQVGVGNAGHLAAAGGISGGAGAAGISSSTAGAVVKGANLAQKLRSVINAASAGRTSAAPNPTLGDGTSSSSDPSTLWRSSGRPLRRFQRTPETIFKNFRATG
jgi:hypothetical protein